MPPTTGPRAKAIAAGHVKRTDAEREGNPAAPPARVDAVVPLVRPGSNAADRAARDAVSPATARLRAIGDDPRMT